MTNAKVFPWKGQSLNIYYMFSYMKEFETKSISLDTIPVREDHGCISYADAIITRTVCVMCRQW
jgi:hypothetical protein